MSDQPEPAITGFLVCDVEDCRALIPDTLEDSRAHRRGHAHREKVDNALRKAVTDLQTAQARLRGETRDDLAQMRKEITGVDRAVKGIEIPAPTPPVVISRRGWDDDEDDDVSTPTERDEWDDLVAPPAPVDDQQSQYAEDLPTQQPEPDEADGPNVAESIRLIGQRAGWERP